LFGGKVLRHAFVVISLLVLHSGVLSLHVLVLVLDHADQALLFSCLLFKLAMLLLDFGGEELSVLLRLFHYFSQHLLSLSFEFNKQRP